MQNLAQLSSELAEIVARVGPAVVRVEARRGAPASGLVWAADGTIVTAEHVLERDEDIRVGLADGRVVGATVAGRDPTTDVAVLRAEASGLTPAAWGGLDRASVGHLVLALSRPGRTIRAHLGIISALGETWRAPSGAEIDRYLQVDVQVFWGFSGGALVDATGTALGMTTAGMLRRAALAVPYSTLQNVVGQLLAQGKIRRGYLGIGGHPVRLPAPMRDQLSQRLGLMVVAVEPGSPAEQSGVMLGDVIVAIDNSPVRHHADVAAHLGAGAVGKSISVRVLRAGGLREVSVKVGERPA